MLDEREVDEQVKARIFLQAQTSFYGMDIVKNSFHDQIANTMFWMQGYGRTSRIC
jgi:hypothetical protein